MFNNPLKKYQQGGQMSTEEAENQMAQALAEAFQMDPQVVKARIREIRQNPEESKLFAQGLQMLQQGDQQNGMAIIGKLFQVPSRKQGGKIDSFICKHAKGRHVAGCGCKEDGGKVTKAQKGEFLEDSAPEQYYNENGVPSNLNRHTTRPGRMLYAEVPTPKGNINFEFNQLNRAVPGGLNLPIKYDVQTRSMLDDYGSVGQQQLPLYQMPYFSRLKEQGAQYEENGGVVKGQEGIPGGIRTATGYTAPRTRNINGIDMQLASISGKGNAFLYTNGADSSFVVHQPYGDRIFTRSNDGAFSGSSNRAMDLGDYVSGFDAEGNLDPSTAETMFNRYRNLENGTTVSRHNPARWTQVQRSGGVVNGSILKQNTKK